MFVSMSQFKFTYDKKRTWDENYSCWRLLNNEERFRYGIREYTSEEAKEKFESYYPKNGNG
jgi:hypothetical protein